MVYLILMAQFRSFIDPFIILMAIPPGLVGVLLILLLHRRHAQHHVADGRDHDDRHRGVEQHSDRGVRRHSARRGPAAAGRRGACLQNSPAPHPHDLAGHAAGHDSHGAWAWKPAANSMRRWPAPLSAGWRCPSPLPSSLFPPCIWSSTAGTNLKPQPRGVSKMHKTRKTKLLRSRLCCCPLAAVHGGRPAWLPAQAVAALGAGGEPARRGRSVHCASGQAPAACPRIPAQTARKQNSPQSRRPPASTARASPSRKRSRSRIRNNPNISIARLLALAQGQVTREARSIELPQAFSDLDAVGCAPRQPHHRRGHFRNPDQFQNFDKAAAGLTVQPTDHRLRPHP